MRCGLAMLMLPVLTACGLHRSLLAPPPPAEIAAPTPPPAGSLWHPELASNYPAIDVRAHFPGDLLTVVISENSQGKKNADTTASAASTISASVEDFFGIPAAAVRALPNGFNPTSIVSAKAARDSKGTATTDRSGALTASITVRVVSVDSAGNLHVQGDQVIRLNREDQYIVLSGTVRPVDIASDNSVQSTRLADARIDYYGRGTVGDKQNVPLVHRLFDWVWAF